MFTGSLIQGAYQLLLPRCPAYTPPVGNNIIINFTTGTGTYVAPNGDTITAQFCIPQ